MRVTKVSCDKILKPCTLLTFNYQLDPYLGCEHICSYCYGLNQAKTSWAEEILIYDDLVERLSDQLSGLEPQTIYIGMNSDPYQQSEKKYYQTRSVLELLAERGFSVSILTKSGLVVRDIELFKLMPSPSVGISLAFADEDTRKRFEKKAPPNQERLAALQKIKAAGIRTYTLICPVMPYISDLEILADMAAPYSEEIWVYSLQMNSAADQNWKNLSAVLKQYYPELVAGYEETAFSGDHAYWHGLKSEVKKIRKNQRVTIIDKI